MFFLLGDLKKFSVKEVCVEKRKATGQVRVRVHVFRHTASRGPRQSPHRRPAKSRPGLEGALDVRVRLEAHGEVRGGGPEGGLKERSRRRGSRLAQGERSRRRGPGGGTRGEVQEERPRTGPCRARRPAPRRACISSRLVLLGECLRVGARVLDQF